MGISYRSLGKLVLLIAFSSFGISCGSEQRPEPEAPEGTPVAPAEAEHAVTPTPVEEEIDQSEQPTASEQEAAEVTVADVAPAPEIVRWGPSFATAGARFNPTPNGSGLWMRVRSNTRKIAVLFGDRQFIPTIGRRDGDKLLSISVGVPDELIQEPRRVQVCVKDLETGLVSKPVIFTLKPQK